MINLEKEELEFIMTVVGNVPVGPMEDTIRKVQVFDKINQISKMRSPVVIDNAVAADVPAPKVAAGKPANGAKAKPKKATKK